MWEQTPEELSHELNKKSNTEIQRQTETLGYLLKIVGETIAENKEVKVENIGREILNKIKLEKPEWIGELKQDLKPLEKKLDYVASAIIRKEVVREVGVKRPDWIKELIPKEIKFPEQKEAEKLIPVLKEVIKEIKALEFPDEVSIKGAVEIKQPKWWKLPDFDKPIVSLAGFIKKYFDKAVLKAEIQNEITVKNPVTEITVKNPQKEVKITNFKEIIEHLKTIVSQLRALGSTGSNGGGNVDTSSLATEETLQSMADPLAKYKDAGMDVASNPMYFGYIALDGSWYIKKLDTTSGTTFCKGDVDYETNWINRASLTYELFNEVF